MSNIKSLCRSHLRLVMVLLMVFLLSACSEDEDGGGQPAADPTPPDNTNTQCRDTYTDYVNANITFINTWEAGKIYDNFWPGGSSNIASHPLWSLQSSNQRSGSATWRCKECHGWDYKGRDGAYASGSHRTGFIGIRAAANKPAIDVFCAIREGEGINADHKFNASNTQNALNNLDILKLTKFVIDNSDNGQVETNNYINPNTKAALGNATQGQTVFGTKANCAGCHNNGLNNISTEDFIATLSVNNPWEVLHKVRFGHPGAIMPAYANDLLTNQLTTNDLRDALSYIQGLAPGGGGTNPTACSTTKATYVTNGINSVNPWEGGALYDKWWAAIQNGTAPVSNHPLWITQNSNTRSGADTWRCKECHGWDYKGRDGAYGAGSHFTGFPGITAAINKTPVEVFCSISEGEGIDSRHQFNAELSDLEILKLTSFITTTGDNGLTDSNTFINPTTKQAQGNATAGQSVYNTTARCASSGCHGVDGLINAGTGNTLGQLSSDNPWEVLHKIRYGHPGSIMPAYINDGLNNQLSPTQISDVLTYTQTLPKLPTSACVTNNQTWVDTNYTTVTAWDGGKLYDKWWVTLNGAAPTTDHPLWATRPSNNNTRTGADTWRCKECHGWDYKGAAGAYGSGSHYTGFIGITGAVGKSPAEVFCAIKEGDGLNALHSFNASNTGNTLQDINILAMAKFILETGDNGLANMDEFINRTSKVALGDATLGQSSYEVKADCDQCHGLDGTQNMGTTTLGALSSGNPWEVLHKIRYGHPGSNPEMPAFIDDVLGTNQLNDNEQKNILAYAQTLPGTVTQPPIGYSACLTDKASYVNTNYATESATQGGALYDKWWAALGYTAGPAANHPVWSQQVDNTRTGSTTWRCKECHGWDYKGRDGAYGTGSSHYTGFIGINGASNMQPINVFCSIYAGTVANADHQFNTTNSTLTDQAVLQLTKFILDPDKGQIDMDQTIDPATKAVIGANVTNGQQDFNSNCARCHGTDGRLHAGNTTLGALATGNPWEVLHKIRYGHPGSSPVMPAFIEDTAVTTTTMRDILAYVQTLPLDPVTGGDPVSNVDLIVQGGLLYDNWIVETEASAPANDNPLWDLQTTNNRTGADTWRCKECHGWDYKGKDGQYRLGSSHYTGFAGVRYVATDDLKSEADVFDFVKNGFVYQETGETLHNYASLLTDDQITALAKFVKQGTVETDTYILPTLGTARGDLASGEAQYVFDGQFIARGNCSLCHGLDGQQINFGTRNAPEYLGDLARANPWEVMHKARFGQPGSIMPSMLQNGLQIDHVVDVITYIQQTLPDAPPPRNNDDD